MKWARKQIRAQKTRYAWDSPFISQAISVKMSSNVDDERLILRTNGVRKTRQAGYIQGDLSMQGLRHGLPHIFELELLVPE